MHTFPAALQTAITKKRIAQIIRITLTDTTVLAYTNHDKALTLDGDTFDPLSGDFGAQGSQRTGTSVDNQVFTLAWDGTDEQDLIDGRYDDAVVEIGIAGWEDAANAFAWLNKYNLGKLNWNRDSIVVDLMGSMRGLANPLGHTFGPRCYAILGDGECQVNIAALAVTGSVTSITTARFAFADTSRAEAEHEFSDGRITWTSGLNNGKTYTVEYSNADDFTLQLPTPKDIQVGDTYSMTPGCNHGPDDCRTKFSNGVNFQGMPFLRGESTLQ